MIEHETAIRAGTELRSPPFGNALITKQWHQAMESCLFSHLYSLWPNECFISPSTLELLQEKFAPALLVCTTSSSG